MGKERGGFKLREKEKKFFPLFVSRYKTNARRVCSVRLEKASRTEITILHHYESSHGGELLSTCMYVQHISILSLCSQKRVTPGSVPIYFYPTDHLIYNFTCLNICSFRDFSLLYHHPLEVIFFYVSLRQ